jgi:DNA-directed RNA polymerase specialized sigma24 family protein
MADQLIDDLRARTPAALSSLVTSYARELVGIAYLVLQHNADAQQATSHAFADAWRHASFADRDQLRATLLRGTVDHALRIREASRVVDPDLGGRTPPALRRLSPQLRVAVALRVRHGMEPDEIERIVAVDPDALAAVLAGTGGAALHAAVARALDGLPVLVDAAMVRAAIAAPPIASRPRWVIPAGAGALGLALLIAIGAAGGSSRPPAGPPVAAATPAPSRSALLPAVGSTEVAPFTLAACQLAPTDSPLAYAGWLTRADLGVGTGANDGAALYALVTSGPADWQGRPTLGYPSFPGTAGRMGCAFDPADGSFAAIGLPDRWQPPEGGDGCPRSPSGEYGGYRELGGPGAFVVPSAGPPGYRAGESDGRLLVRIAPGDEPVTSVHATLDGPDGKRTVEARVASETVATAVTTSSWYLWLHGVSVPTPGCWTLNVTVDGAVVGVASLPFSAPD